MLISLNMPFFGMEAPEPQKPHVALPEIPSLRDLASNEVVNKLTYFLLSDPQAINKLTINDDTLMNLLKRKIIQSGLWQDEIATINTEAPVSDLCVLDKEKQLIAAGLANGTILIVDLKNKQILKQIATEGVIIRIKAISPEKIVWIGINKKSEPILGIYDLIYNTQNITLLCFEPWGACICVINTKQIAIAPYNENVFIWDIETQKKLSSIEGTQGATKLVLLKNNRLLCISRNNWAKVWNLEKSCLEGTIVDGKGMPCLENLALLAKISQEYPALFHDVSSSFINSPVLTCESGLIPLLSSITDSCTFLQSSEFKNLCNPLITLNRESVIITCKGQSRVLMRNNSRGSFIIKLDDHHVVISNGSGYDTGNITIYDIPETYSLPELLIRLHQRAKTLLQDHQLALKPQSAQAVTDIIFLAQKLSEQQSKINPALDDIQKQRILIYQMSPLLESLLERYSQPETRIAYLFSLLKQAEQFKNSDLIDLIIYKLCAQLQPLTPEQLQQLPMDLRAYRCVALLNPTDNKMVLIPEYVAYQSPVLKALFTNGMKESRERTAMLHALDGQPEYDCATINAVKKLLYYAYQNINQEDEEAMARQYHSLKTFTKNANAQVYKRLTHYFSDLEELPTLALPLAHQLQIPCIQSLTLYLFNECQEKPDMLKDLFESTPTECHHYFVPHCLDPQSGILPIQLDLLADLISNKEKYDNLFYSSDLGKKLQYTETQDERNFVRLCDNYATFIVEHLPQLMKLHPNFDEYLEKYPVEYLKDKVRELLGKKLTVTFEECKDPIKSIIAMNKNECVIILGDSSYYKKKIVILNVETKKVISLALDDQLDDLHIIREITQLDQEHIIVLYQNVKGYPNQRTIIVYNIHTGKRIYTCRHDRATHCLSLQAKEFISISDDSIKIWNIASDTYRIIPFQTPYYISGPLAKLNDTTIIGLKQANAVEQTIVLFDLVTGSIIKEFSLKFQFFGNTQISVINSDTILAWHPDLARFKCILTPSTGQTYQLNGARMLHTMLILDENHILMQPTHNNPFSLHPAIMDLFTKKITEIDAETENAMGLFAGNNMVYKILYGISQKNKSIWCLILSPYHQLFNLKNLIWHYLAQKS